MNFFDIIASTNQGKVATVGYVILILAVAFSIFYQNNHTDKEDRLSVLEIIVILFLIFVAYVLAVYSINCMVVGEKAGYGCGVWAWINSIIVIVFAIGVVLSVLFT